MAMVGAGYVEIADLPVLNGVLDHQEIQQCVQLSGSAENVFLVCAALQHIFCLNLGIPWSECKFPEHLEGCSKKLLAVQCQYLFSLDAWALSLGEEISFVDQQLAFKQMLKKCKFPNFLKLTSRFYTIILATPALIAKIRGSNGLWFCQWCGEVANIDHILIHCTETNKVYDKLAVIEQFRFMKRDRVLGAQSNRNPVLWVVNFAIYKVHI